MKKKEPAKKSQKSAKPAKSAAEKIDCLLELHNLQRILLTQLRKEM